ncbi:MAG: PilZ domain-containing protein [Candidatus Omnitrophota bacterium]|nr:PilZ domain-containing protein [Candidatus Omnitrophota bacterium]MBU2221947.1 PilZ domain-containing protein [Candidatus Omnitrophota bacterium]
MNTKEQRNNVRWHISRPIKIKLDGVGDFVDCQLININYKGLQLSLGPKVIEKDQFLNLSILLDDNFTLDIETWVVWHRVIDNRNLYGFYFIKIKDSDKDSLFKFVFKYAPQEVNKHWWEGLKAGEEIMTQSQNFEDKRVFARFPMELSLRFLEPSATREGLARSVDISSKGLGLVTEEKLVPDTSLEMWLSVPDRPEPLYTRGQVIWSEGSGASGFRCGIKLERADLMSLTRNFKG